MENCGKGAITRAALGRLGFIGELYDARTESLSSRSLFKSTLPKKAIECRDLGRMEFDYNFTENISDCFDLIKVEPELQLGVLCDLIKLEGSGKFFTDQKKSEKIVSCSLICKFETVCEKFYASWNEILNSVDLEALENDKNTHVIVECYWGANCLLSMECYCKSESEKQEVKGCLQADLKMLSKMFGVKGGCSLEKIREGLSRKNDIQIKVNADVLPKNTWPTTPEDFCKFVQEVPELLKELNEGKGKPLKYVMIPLCTIRKLAKVECAIEGMVVQIGESFLLSTIYFFDEIGVIKRKFYDHLSEMEKYRKYIYAEYYQKSKTEFRDLILKESTLKQIIADDWASVRSGAKPLKDLIKTVEKFKNQFNLIGYESFFDSDQEMRKKLSCIKNCLSKGIVYLGLGETFSELLTQNPLTEFIVCLISGETKESELGQKTLNYFLTLKLTSKSETRFVVIDEDYTPALLDNKVRPPRCVHLLGSKLLSQDLYGQYVREMELNLARPSDELSAIYVTHKPANRVPLEMACPNFQKNICKPDLLEWACFRCKSTIEYGFDEFFYCSCGKSSSSLYTFKCSDPKHGDVFVAPKDEFLEKMLSNLRSFKNLNLLVLGQSGVGKSTWINAIINYLNYETLENAERQGVICTIPISFPVYDTRTLKMKTVSLGEENNRENTEAGNSGTLCCHTYSFYWENRLVSLIDSPGLGDTRGIEQDKRNIQNVMTYIENLKELHGICILLKATDNRSTDFFSYCIKELLVNLHRSVTKNIIFCFTNARNTFYAPGPVAVILERIIAGLGIAKELPLGHHNMFCLDNEAFLFLCSLKHPDAKFGNNLKSSLVESWKISLTETERLFKTIKNFQPQSLEETMALFKVRSRVLSLIRPLAQNSKTIQVNVNAIEEKEKEITNSEQKLEELSQNLTIKELHLVQDPLPKPRTVCTKPSCVSYILCKSLNVTNIEYKTHCHSSCNLTDVELRTVNNSDLINCAAMVNGICTVCGCSWTHHMHIKESQRQVLKEVLNVKIEKDINDEKSAREAIENFLEFLKSRNKKYRDENKFIVQTIAKFGAFLKKNAITVYNDSVAAYLKFLITEQENKLYKSEVDLRVLEDMKKTLACYEEEVETFEKALSDADKEENITAKDIDILEKKLFELELTGSAIKESVLMERKIAKAPYQQTMIQLKKKKLPSQFEGLIQKAKDAVKSFFFPVA